MQFFHTQFPVLKKGFAERGFFLYIGRESQQAVNKEPTNKTKHGKAGFHRGFAIAVHYL